MKYLVNIILAGGEVITGIFARDDAELEECIEHIRNTRPDFRKIVVYDNETRDAVRIVRP